MTILTMLVLLWLLPSLVFLGVATLAIPGSAIRRLRRAALAASARNAAARGEHAIGGAI